MELVLGTLPVAAPERDVEIVEHKGLGHPDTICDALAEELSRALSRHYLARFGAILHHNVDKALLWGGAARPAFGGGEVLAPIEIFLAGRAVRDVRGVAVPIDELFAESATRWLSRHLHALDPARHVRLHALVRAGSAELVDLFERQGRGGELANDTSFGVGYAPLSPLERTVLAVAREIERLAADPASAHVGEDAKVMGVRDGARVRITVACAFVGAHVASLASYADLRAALAGRLAAVARAELGGGVELVVNAADDLARGDVYLTVTGTSAEAGDDGQVGRGNRVNGLITPYRPMTLEAAAGKNPVTHVGKLYAITAHEIAASVAALPSVAEATCMLVSRIGSPVREPELAEVRVRTRDGAPASALARDVEPIVRASLDGIGTIAERLLAGAIRVY